MSQPLRIVFAGTPEFSVPPLQALLDAGQRLVGVFTQPDRPAGRGRKLTPSPVKQLAVERGLAVFQPKNFRAEADLAGHLAELDGFTLADQQERVCKALGISVGQFNRFLKVAQGEMLANHRLSQNGPFELDATRQEGIAESQFRERTRLRRLA